MAGDELLAVLTEMPASLSSARKAAMRHRHQRRLRVLGQRQGLRRPLPDDVGQLLAERLVDLVEHRARFRKGLGKRLAHADRLAALAGKRER